MQRQRGLQKSKESGSGTQSCSRGKCEYTVGGSRQGTLQQLVWIIRGVGGASQLREVEGRLGDSWRQDRASRSGRMTITKILAGSYNPVERGSSWLTPPTATGWAGKWTASVWEWKRDAPTSTSYEIAPSCHWETYRNTKVSWNIQVSLKYQMSICMNTLVLLDFLCNFCLFLLDLVQPAACKVQLSPKCLHESELITWSQNCNGGLQ